MNKIKQIVIGMCAAFGILVAIAGFTGNQNSTECGVPESHEWQMFTSNSNNMDYVFNKKTGEVRLVSENRKKLIKLKVDENE